MRSRNRAEAARAVLDLRSQYLAITVASYIAIDPRLPMLAAFHSASPADPAPTLELPGPDGEAAVFPVVEVLREASRMGWGPMRSTLLAAQHATGVQLGEVVKSLNLSKVERETQLFQFVGHYRNGCAHNGRWSIDQRAFRAGSFAGVTVAIDDHDKPVTEKVTPYLHVRLIEAVADHLGPPAVADGIDGWRPRGEGLLAGRPRPASGINTMPPVRG